MIHMDYVREHVKKYWGITYRRTLGVAFATFAIALSIGMTFMSLTSAFVISNYYVYIIFWVLLFVMAIIIFLANFFSSHVTSVGLMTDVEHRNHSAQMAKWMVVLVLGIVAFVLPLMFVGSLIEPLMVLFAFGGVLLVLYLSVAILFKHSYGELTIGCITFWLLFIFGILTVNGSVVNAAAKGSFAIYFSAMSMAVVSGFVGLAMIVNSSSDSFKEFTRTIEDFKSKPKRPRRKKKRKLVVK